MASVGASRGLGALFKRGWNEIPEIMGSSFMGLLGIGMALIGYSIYGNKDEVYRKHKFNYIVVRPDDPRAPKKQDK